MTLGFALASASWFLMGAFPTLTMTVVAIAIFAIGEAIQAPRYYAYVADLAPKAQVGTYMGFAFLPVALGTFICGDDRPGGSSPTTCRGPPRRGRCGISSARSASSSTLLMVLYDRFVTPRPAAQDRG